MTKAEESLRILRNRYDAGLVPLTDVLRAEDAEHRAIAVTGRRCITTH